MKFSKNYKPKYSLSIKYLAMFLSKQELNSLLNRYIEAKNANWQKSIKGKK